eukprot:Colp12_sorted_trinity150504_noHs@22538
MAARPPVKGFAYSDVNCHVKTHFKDGQWGPLETETDPHVNLHIGATVLHYGQAIFEGLKAFRCKDGQIRLFRPWENAKRLANSADRLLMPVVPETLFMEAVTRCVRILQ